MTSAMSVPHAQLKPNNTLPNGLRVCVVFHSLVKKNGHHQSTKNFNFEGHQRAVAHACTCPGRKRHVFVLLCNPSEPAHSNQYANNIYTYTCRHGIFAEFK